MTTGTCKRCGSQFERRSWNAIYCGRECNEAAWNEKRTKPNDRWVFTCQCCGKDYQAKSPERNKYCSRECAFKAKQDQSVGKWIHWWFKDCRVCGERFITVLKAQFLCGSRECGLAYHRGQRDVGCKPEHNYRPCKGCGSAQVYWRRKYCQECSKRRQRESNKANRRNRGADNHRERARRNGSLYVAVSKRLIIETHGLKCHICGKRINLKRKFPDPQSFSIDHVVPLSLGGWHDLTNIKPAHLQCNTDKGAEYVGQLMLKPAMGGAV